MKRVTMADVAAHSGVSKMTVSCVVRGVQCVKEETKNRVEASLAELGYRADPVLRGLSAYRSRVSKSSSGYRSTLAYLDCDLDEYSMSMFKNAELEAQPLGYAIKHLKLPQEDEEQRRMSRRLWLQGIQGLLFGPSREERYIGGFQVEHFSMAGIGAFHHSPAIDSVGADYFQGLYLAAQQCYEHGARRIALAIPDYLEARTGHRWLGAYHAFCQHYKITPLQCSDEENINSRKFVSWIREQKVEALLGLQGITLLKRRLPKVLFVALNDWQSVSDDWHIHTPQELIAREAVQIIDYNLLHQRYGIPQWPRHISVEGRWQTHHSAVTATKG